MFELENGTGQKKDYKKGSSLDGLWNRLLLIFQMKRIHILQ